MSRPLAPSSLPAARPRWRRLTRRWRRNTLRYGTAAILMAALDGSGFWLWKSGLAARSYGWTIERVLKVTADLGLKVGDVLVEGRNETRSQALLVALGVKRGAPLLGVDLAAAKARLEALPWVRTASIERRWPQLLYVKIEERTPLALWQGKSAIKLIDREGKVIEGADVHRFASLPMVVGEGAASQAPGFLEILVKEPTLARRVQAAIWVGNRRWNLRLADGIDVRLPEAAPEEALVRLVDYEAKERLFERDIVMIDLRLPDRVIVRLSPDAAQRERKPGKNT